MAILPIDIQALLVRMDSISRMQQAQQEGIAIAQTIKGSEMSELAQVQSSRVNQVNPHQNGSSKIEDEQKKQRKSSLAKRHRGETEEKKKEQSEFEEPYKGTMIDTER